MKYLVMECHPAYVILLDEQGGFVRAANLRYEVGQTIENPILMREPQTIEQNIAVSEEKDTNITDKTVRKSSMKKWMSTMAAMAACVMLLFVGYYQNGMAYTSIYLTINPEVQMELNRRGNVVDLIGLNADGQDLLEGYKLVSRDRLEVTDDLIDRAIDMGYLAEGGYIAIDIDTPDDARFQQYDAELRENVAQHVAERMRVTIEITRRVEPSQPQNQSQTIRTDGSGANAESDYDDRDGDGENQTVTVTNPTEPKRNNSGYQDADYTADSMYGTEDDNQSDSMYGIEDDNQSDSMYGTDDDNLSDSMYDIQENTEADSMYGDDSYSDDAYIESGSSNYAGNDSGYEDTSASDDDDSSEDD